MTCRFDDKGEVTNLQLRQLGRLGDTAILRIDGFLSLLCLVAARRFGGSMMLYGLKNSTV